MTAPSDTPLLPCPFCGGPASTYQDAEWVWEVSCEQQDCGASMRLYGYRSYSAEQTERAATIAAWNRRPRPPGEPQEDSALTPRASSQSELVAALRPFANITLSSIYSEGEADGYTCYLDHTDGCYFRRPNVLRARQLIAKYSEPSEPRGEARPNPPALPAEAVEAGAMIIFGNDLAWPQMLEKNRERYREKARAVLALASPRRRYD